MHGFQPIRWARAGRAVEPRHAARRIFWVMGTGGQALVDTGAADLRPGQLDFAGRPSLGDIDHRQLFSRGIGDPCGSERQARKACGTAVKILGLPGSC